MKENKDKIGRIIFVGPDCDGKLREYKSEIYRDLMAGIRESFDFICDLDLPGLNSSSQHHKPENNVINFSVSRKGFKSRPLEK